MRKAYSTSYKPLIRYRGRSRRWSPLFQGPKRPFNAILARIIRGRVLHNRREIVAEMVLDAFPYFFNRPKRKRHGK